MSAPSPLLTRSTPGQHLVKQSTTSHHITPQGDINTKEMLFVTMAGLRGSASLIMGSAVVTQQFSKVSGSPDTFSVGVVAAGSICRGVVAGCCLLEAVAGQQNLNQGVHAGLESMVDISTAQHTDVPPTAAPCNCAEPPVC
jgi:hypothetical protein